MEKLTLLELLSEKAEEESRILTKKSAFILTVLNEIGCSLNKNFEIIKEFDIEANFDALKTIYDYFIPKCKDFAKRLALEIIFALIVQYDDLNENKEKLINAIMRIFTNNNLNVKEKNLIMDKLMNNELKFCLKQEQHDFFLKYNKIFEMKLENFLEILFHIVSVDSSKNFPSYILKELKNYFKNIIITDSMINSIEFKDGDCFHCLNQLFDLLYKIDDNDDISILIFENSVFQLRKPTDKELEAYFDEGTAKKSSKKKSKNSSKNNKNDIDKISNKPNTISTNQISPPKNITFSQVDLYLLSELENVKAELRDTKAELKDTKDELSDTKDELRENNMKFQMRIGNLESDLKKIKIRSIYKGIIDIFTSVCNKNLNDNYYNKLNTLLEVLNKYPKNKKINELCGFLTDTYYSLRKGNSLAHVIDEYTAPLELIFSLLEKDKKEYPKIKLILNNLSFNETLQYALNNYYSIKDKKKLIGNIRFTLEDLESQLQS